MELLLLENIEGLGARGQIVTVARGYARNFLLPKKLAKVPNEQLVAEVRARSEKIKAAELVQKGEKMELAKGLATVVLSIPMRASEEGHLYGSVGPRQIVEGLASQGHDVDEKQVVLEAPLKDLGDYDVVVALHPEVRVPIKVAVVSEEGQDA